MDKVASSKNIQGKGVADSIPVDRYRTDVDRYKKISLFVVGRAGLYIK